MDATPFIALPEHITALGFLSAICVGDTVHRFLPELPGPVKGIDLYQGNRVIFLGNGWRHLVDPASEEHLRNEFIRLCHQYS